MKLTIFTPCYNKGRTIQRTYDSLVKQRLFDFEWIVINDGSTDESDYIIRSFDTKYFPINYIKQDNKGLPSVVNTAVNEAQGNYILRLDGDDYLVPNAVETIINKINTDEELMDAKVGALVFITCYDNGVIVGSHPFQNRKRCNFLDYRIKYGAKGDRAEVFKTRLFKKFPMPVIPGEKFCPEACVWNLFSDKYDAIYYPETIYVREYNDDSITSNVTSCFIRNPKGRIMCSTDYLNRNVPLKLFIKESIIYYRFAPYTKYSIKHLIMQIPVKSTMIGVIPGLLLFCLDRINPKLVSYFQRLLHLI